MKRSWFGVQSFVRSTMILLLASVQWNGSVHALDPRSTDARAILRAALDRQGGLSTLGRMRMQIRDHTGSRERLLTVRSKRYDDARKTLILVEQPADLRNTGFLVVDYRTENGKDEQWLYLPKLHRVTRVPRSGKSEPFVGSDFTIGDLAPQDPEEFDAKVVESDVRVGEEECWMIEATPRTQAAKEESGYEKMQIWVSKQKELTIQLKAWLLNGKGTKYFKATDIRLVDGIWTAHRMQMRTMEGAELRSETVIELLSVDNNAADVSDSDFTQQRLERGV